MMEFVGSFYPLLIAAKEFAIFAFFIVMIWAVIKTVNDGKKKE